MNSARFVFPLVPQAPAVSAEGDPSAPLSPAPSAEPVAKDDRVGMEIGRYVVTRRLGGGGMGVVYEARDKVLRRPVAIKFFAEAVAVTRDAVKRFVLEAQAAARLSHPNVVSVFEVGRREGVHFLVMELVPGLSAEEHLKRSGKFDWVTAARIASAACRGLAAAHAASLIHRDIKPANILLSEDEASGDAPQWHVKVGDFGLAKLMDGGASMATAADRVLGTPHYMSPEQCRAESLDPRSDLYSLGATYYSLLSGRLPFAGDQPMQVMFAHCWTAPPDPRQTDPAIPAACAAIVRRGMAKDPRDRYRSAKEMLADLETALFDPTVTPAFANHPVREALPQPAGQPTAPRDPDPAASLALLPMRRDVSLVSDSAPRPLRGTPPLWRKIRLPVGAGLVLLSAGAILFAVARWRGGDGEGNPVAAALPAARAAAPRAAAATRSVSVASPDRMSFTPAVASPSTVPATTPAPASALPSFTQPRWVLDAGGTPASVAFSPDGTKLVAAVSDSGGGLRGWGVADGREFSATFLGQPCRGVAFVPDPAGRVVYTGLGGSVLQYSYMQESRRNFPLAAGGEIASMAWSSDGRVLAVVARPPQNNARSFVKLFDAADHEIPFTPEPARDVLAIGFVGKLSILATGGVDATLRLWAVDQITGGRAPLVRAIDTGVIVTSIASSQSGRVIAAGGRQSVQFFDPEGNLIGRAFRPNQNVRSLALSADGALAAVGSGADKGGGGVVTLYDVTTGGRIIGELRGHDGAVSALAFSPDDKLLATASVDHTVRVWDTAPSRRQGGGSGNVAKGK